MRHTKSTTAWGEQHRHLQRGAKAFGRQLPGLQPFRQVSTNTWTATAASSPPQCPPLNGENGLTTSTGKQKNAVERGVGGGRGHDDGNGTRVPWHSPFSNVENYMLRKPILSALTAPIHRAVEIVRRRQLCFKVPGQNSLSLRPNNLNPFIPLARRNPSLLATTSKPASGSDATSLKLPCCIVEDEGWKVLGWSEWARDW